MRDEAQYRQAHLFRARWGFEGPRSTWRAFWAEHNQSLQAAEAKLTLREREKQALLDDPRWQKECMHAVQKEQEHLESRRQAAAARAQSLERQSTQYAQDQKMGAQMQREHQERAERMKGYRAHETELQKELESANTKQQDDQQQQPIGRFTVSQKQADIIVHGEHLKALHRYSEREVSR